MGDADAVVEAVARAAVTAGSEFAAADDAAAVAVGGVGGGEMRRVIGHP